MKLILLIFAYSAILMSCSKKDSSSNINTTSFKALLTSTNPALNGSATATYDGSRFNIDVINNTGLISQVGDGVFDRSNGYAVLYFYNTIPSPWSSFKILSPNEVTDLMANLFEVRLYSTGFPAATIVLQGTLIKQ